MCLPGPKNAGPQMIPHIVNHHSRYSKAVDFTTGCQFYHLIRYLTDFCTITWSEGWICLSGYLFRRRLDRPFLVRLVAGVGGKRPSKWGN